MDNLLEEVVAPELATMGSRIISGFIDILGMIALMFGVGLMFDQVNTDNGGLNVTLEGTSSLVFFALWFVAFPLAEGYTGQTLGKKLVGTRVWDKNDKKPTVLQSILRHLLDVIDYCVIFGILVASLTKKRQRIGDLVANTIVIKK
jgi:uncharacterized RDD family membrane protein YckC